LGYYNGTQPGRIVGLFGDDSLDNSKVIYWWNSVAAWDSLLLYWDYTGDPQYNSLVQQALLFQTGPNNDYMPPNQTKTEVLKASLSPGMNRADAGHNLGQR